MSNKRQLISNTSSISRGLGSYHDDSLSDCEGINFGPSFAGLGKTPRREITLIKTSSGGGMTDDSYAYRQHLTFKDEESMQRYNREAINRLLESGGEEINRPRVEPPSQSAYCRISPRETWGGC